MRSNAAVGPPIEVLLYETDSLSFDRHVSFDADHPYLMSLKSNWESALAEAFANLPKFDWSGPNTQDRTGESGY